jgi:hypothetical protein
MFSMVSTPSKGLTRKGVTFQQTFLEDLSLPLVDAERRPSVESVAWSEAWQLDATTNFNDIEREEDLEEAEREMEARNNAIRNSGRTAADSTADELEDSIVHEPERIVASPPVVKQTASKDYVTVRKADVSSVRDAQGRTKENAVVPRASPATESLADSDRTGSEVRGSTCLCTSVFVARRPFNHPLCKAACAPILSLSYLSVKRSEGFGNVTREIRHLLRGDPV